jgi:uncharacterized protein (DUF362 family)
MSQSKVAVIRGKGVISSGRDLDQSITAAMLRRGAQIVCGNLNEKNGFGGLVSGTDRVGIKINTIGGRNISSRPQLSLALAGLVAESGLQQKNIVIWDRTNRELKEAGYRLSDSASGLKIFGTDTIGAGYEIDLVSHLNIGSLFSTIQTNFVTASISLAILKDHGLAGVTAGMKNYFGAIHNPNKYHDSHCDPFVAELFDTSIIKLKHRLTILDALVVQYHRGPSYHPQWAEACGILILGLDAVAVDSVGWRLIEKLRARKGLASLKEEGREPSYLWTAERMGLGQAAVEKIQIIEDEV